MNNKISGTLISATQHSFRIIPSGTFWDNRYNKKLLSQSVMHFKVNLKEYKITLNLRTPADQNFNKCLQFIVSHGFNLLTIEHLAKSNTIFEQKFKFVTCTNHTAMSDYSQNGVLVQEFELNYQNIS